MASNYRPFAEFRHGFCNNAQTRVANMQWDDLRIFLAVARARSISGAATRLGLQHSTVSRRLRALEERLGTRLTERKASGYELTEAGEELQLSALKIEAEILGFEGTRSGEDAGASGELRVTAINNMASSVLMPAFARFSAAYPEIAISRGGERGNSPFFPALAAAASDATLRCVATFNDDGRTRR